MDFECITLDQVEAGIYRLTINRPKALNALNSKVLDELASAIASVKADEAARALIVTGGGERAFVAGADIVEMSRMTGAEGQRFSEQGLAVMRSLELLPVPVIAAVHGYALGGGCELALSCDWIIASEKAVFGQPEVSLGIPPGMGGTQRLPRRVGRGLAMELILTGRQIKVDEALRIGLVNQVVAPAQLQQTALDHARLVASRAPLAIRYAKQLVMHGPDLDLANACLLESDVFGLACSTEDKHEGMTAFVEKRPASFSGR